MKPEFKEDTVSEQADPVEARVIDFDWNTLYERLGEQAPQPDHQKLALALRRILQWAVRVDYDLVLSPITPDVAVGRRMIALAWVTNPALFPDSPSLRQLSRRLGLSAPLLAALTGEVCREFGIQNRAQDHAWNRK